MKPLVLLTISAFATDLLFPASSRRELEESFDVAVVSDEDVAFDELLPRAFAVIGQPDLPIERIRRAEQLRAVCNVEGNFFPNVDYAACFDDAATPYDALLADYDFGLTAARIDDVFARLAEVLPGLVQEAAGRPAPPDPDVPIAAQQAAVAGALARLGADAGAPLPPGTPLPSPRPPWPGVPRPWAASPGS